MNIILPPLTSGATGSAAASLVDAVLFLSENGAIGTFAPPNQPTAAELRRLTSAAREERAAAVFGPATQQLLRYLRLQNGLGDTSPGLVDEATAALLNRALQQRGGFAAPSIIEAGRCVVRGRVTRFDGTPVEGVIVRASDRDLRTFQNLGRETTTDAEGHYSIAYSTSEFSRAEKGTADLVVSLFDAADDQTPIAVSDTLFDAPAVAEVNFQRPDLPESTSEFDRYVRAIEPLLQGQGKEGAPLHFAQLIESDLPFLARETTAPVDHIDSLRRAFVATGAAADLASGEHGAARDDAYRLIDVSENEDATQFTRKPKHRAGPLSPDVCYAWFRGGVAGDLRSALQKTTPELVALVATAVASNLVPRRLSGGLDDLPQTIDELRLLVALRPSGRPQSPSLGDLLATMPTRLDPEKERAVATVLQRGASDDAQIERQLIDARLSDSDIAAVQVTRALAGLTAGQPGVMRELQKRRMSDTDRSLRFLAQLTPAEWLELAYENQHEQSAAPSPEVYAEQMQEALEMLHPTAMLSGRIASGDLIPPSEGFIKAADFLEAHPDLELRGTNVVNFVNRVQPGQDAAEIVSNLQTLQRVQNLTGSWRDTGTLLDAGVGTVRDVLRMGKAGFADAIADRMAPERAAKIFDEAARIHDTTVALVGKAYAGARHAGFGHAGPRDPAAAAPPIPSADFPNIATLFGSPSTCECEECQSVLSPAAYLVDLLHFLGSSSDAQANPALPVLLARRPDIADIELTCANTKIEVPYIDLVTEVLENAIAFPMEVSRPYGFDPRVDLARSSLSAPVTGALRRVLSRSAASMAETLSVRKSPKNLVPGTFDDWLVDDGFRQWVLRYYPESLTAKRGSASPVVLKMNDYAAAVEGLDVGKVPDDWVLPPTKDRRSQHLPLDGKPTIRVATAGTTWQVTYVRGVRVAITRTRSTGTLVLKTADGARELDAVSVPTPLLPALISALNDSRLAQPLDALLPPLTRYRIEKDGAEWVIRVTENVNFTYSPERLQIASLTYQSSDARVDAVATPENRNPEAYRKLAGAVYPWSLPFDLWLEEVRAFLARRGVRRRELMEQSQPTARLSSAAVAREMLGLSLAQAAIIAGTDPRDAWIFWGLKETQNRVIDRNEPSIVATGTWRNVLGTNVSLLLQQSGLGYRELLNVLQTRFVRAAMPVLTPTGDDCNPSRMRLARLTAAHLDRIHRLVRLWRAVRGSIFDLDLAIAATPVNPTTLDETALVRVAGIKRIEQALSIPISEIAAWWDGVTVSYVDYTAGEGTPVASVYERWFLNTNITNPPDSQLLLNPQKSELQYDDPANPPALAAKWSSLTAVLGVSRADFDALIADLVSRNEIAAPAVLSLRNLIRLFRQVSMARGLSLPLSAYLRLKRIVAIDPFADAASAIEFIERVQFVQSSGFPIDALNYLFTYTLDQGPGTVMRFAWASQLLSGIRSRIQSAQATQLAGGATPTESLARALAVIGWPEWLVAEAVGWITAPAGLSIRIAGAPAVTIPAGLARLVTYRHDDGTLTASPGMTANQWTALEAANGAAAVQAAIAALRAQATDFETALPDRVHLFQSFALPTFSVAAAAVPTIPQDLARQCYFDAAQRRLVFVGWMSDAQRTRLQQILPVGQVALADQLKTQSDQYDEQEPLNRFLFDRNEATALFAAAETLDTRVQAVLARLAPFVARTALVAQLTQALDLDAAIVELLLTSQLSRASVLDPLLASSFIAGDQRVTPTLDAFPAQFAALAKLHKVALILRTLEITREELAWLPPAMAGGTRFDVLPLDALPVVQGDATPDFDAWRRLVLLFRMRSDRRVGGALLAGLQAWLTLTPATLTAIQADAAGQHAFLAQSTESTLDDVVWVAQTQLQLQWPADYQVEANVSLVIQWLLRARLARALGVSAQDVADAVAGLGLAWPDDFKDAAKLSDLIRWLTTVQRLGVGTAGALSLLQDVAPAGGNPGKPGKEEAELARKVMRARYDPASWPANLKKVVDPLRDSQRAALVSYLIANPPANAIGSGLWKAPADLYDHFLIDPEMSPCRTSSRILHAISAVQLFVQRCALNLEPDVSPSAIAAGRLPWMTQFRVWQAGRRVFLFPENWIEPELRDDKSEIFKNLEGQLLQDELDAARAADIVKGYLKELEDISRLAIVGLYVEKGLDALANPEARVHIVGRTRNRPSHFYYRRWVISTLRNTWEPWERVSLEGVKSEHILPFVMRGEVYIAWPEITQIAAERGTDSKDPGPSWRVQMTWIRRTTRGWSDRLLSADALEHPWVFGKDENQTFTFRVRNEQSGGISIDCYGAERDASDGLLYEEPPTGEIPDFRTFVPFPDTAPWITVQIRGVVYGAYSGGSGAVWRPLKGATVSVATILHGSAQQINDANNDLKWDLEHSIYVNTDKSSVVTDDLGTFNLNLSLFAQLHDENILSHSNGYYRLRILEASPSFDVKVSFPGKTGKTKSFSYADPNNNDQHQHWSREMFQQDFIIDVGGPPPGGDANRPVRMAPLMTFRLLAADDARFEGFDTPFPELPTGVLTYGSGFRITNAGQSAALSFDGNPNTPVVWTGVAPTYTLLRNAPFNPDLSPGAAPSAVTPAEVCVYSDDRDSFFIRREEALTDPPQMANRFQILLDGHSMIGDLRRDAAVSGPAHVFDLAQQTWSAASPNATPQLFGNHSASALVDLNTSLILPAIYFEPDASQSPYAKYNAELFFQVPFLIATFLSRNQRFADAQTWLHYVFNPAASANGDSAPVPERYWRYKPFRDHSRTTPIEELMRLLADPSVPNSNPDKRDITTQIALWLQNPFAPHAIARTRLRAYEFAVVFKYLDNLIAWGDSLFRQYSTESINLATQLYILAVKLLGPRPQSIPRARKAPPLTYRDLNNRWDAFSNAWVEIETNLALHEAVNETTRLPWRPASDEAELSLLSNIGMTYFCVPGNDKILSYWSTLDQRLFNIRHCRNIDGVEQPVPPFQPPIDPALLVRAAAAGIDISSVVADMVAPIPYYRFNDVLQKASELCAELRSLGSALLSALEKRDAEDLSLLRSAQEIEMLTLVQAVKEAQVEEAKANIATLRQSEQVATTRFVQYQRLLGKNGAKVPDDEGADVEQSSAVRVAAGDATGDFGSLGLTKPEYDQIAYSEEALRFGTVAGIHSVVSGILYAIPGTDAGTPFLSTYFGGMNLGSVVGAAGSFWGVLERNSTHQASRSASIGQYQRRQDDWVFQSRMALRDVQQVRKQLVAAQIRLDITTKDLDNHKQQISQAKESDRLMREKYTNRELYQWMTQQIYAAYFRAYQLAYDVAKRAERCFRFELGLSESSFITYGYWDSLKKGLTAGDRLALDLRRMEAAYLEQNRREFEITKHVSLAQLDSEALMALRQLAGCEFSIPEVLYDLDFPGHYFRRLKSVSLSIPCVVGPHGGVPATLKLVKSSVRTKATADPGYGPVADDPRFIDLLAGVQAVALSSAQNDPGLFDGNMRDERFLPFEGMGAISTWRVELPASFRPFDYESIADVILHIRYTARDGGEDLRSAALASLGGGLNSMVHVSRTQGLTRLFSFKSDFPAEWYRLTHPADGAADAAVDVTLSRNRFPYLFSSNQIKLTITGIDVYAVPDSTVQNPAFPDFLDVSVPGDPTPLDWPTAKEIGPLLGRSASTNVAVTAQDATSKWTLKVTAADAATLRNETDDILFVCRYKVT
jgi:hypothetical protein